MYPIDLEGKNGIVFGVANDRSIAWAIAQVLQQAGARLAFTYQNERLKDRVAKLAGGSLLLECDVSDDQRIASVFGEVAEQFGNLDFLVHSVAFANRDDLGGDFSLTSREGFRVALEISAFSLLPLVRHAAPLMPNGGSILAMTFQASERVFPGYNIMGTAKAALENEVRQLAAGERRIGRTSRNAGGARHSRIPGHEEGPRSARSHGAQHYPRRSGENSSVPVQQSLQRHHRFNHPGGRWVPHYGSVRGY